MQRASVGRLADGPSRTSEGSDRLPNFLPYLLCPLPPFLFLHPGPFTACFLIRNPRFTFGSLVVTHTLTSCLSPPQARMPLWSGLGVEATPTSSSSPSSPLRDLCADVPRRLRTPYSGSFPKFRRSPRTSPHNRGLRHQCQGAARPPVNRRHCASALNAWSQGAAHGRRAEKAIDAMAGKAADRWTLGGADYQR